MCEVGLSIKYSHPHCSIGICSFINYYEELSALVRCLDSVRDIPVIIIDGKWKDFPGERQNSIDEAFGIYNQYENVTVIKKSGLSEAEARTLAFNECKTEYMLVLDTDEYIEAPLGFDFFENHLHTCSASSVFYHRKGSGWSKAHRIVRFPQKIQLSKHNSWYKESCGHAIMGLNVYENREHKPEKRLNDMLLFWKTNPNH